MNFEVGDIVEWCGVRGQVQATTGSWPYHLTVGFGASGVDYFTLDGKVQDWHKEPSLKLIERPKKEPEVYEFDCEWTTFGRTLVPTHMDLAKFPLALAEKRTRVKIEVIE